MHCMNPKDKGTQRQFVAMTEALWYSLDAGSVYFIH
jgi:hypothetical protein